MRFAMLGKWWPVQTVVAAVLALGSIAGTPAGLRAQESTATIMGVVFDSLHGVGLAKATVLIVGTTHRTVTNDRGIYVLSGLPPGQMRLDVQHPLLDTLGMSLISDAFTLAAGQRATMSVHTQTLEELRQRSCPRGGSALRRGILLGLLRDADADSALAGGTASLVYTDPDAIDKSERVRTARVGADGRFVICGLPDTYKGSVQIVRNGRTTADLRVEPKGALFASAGLTIGTNAVNAATLFGRVLQRSGAGAPGVQVVVAGSPIVAVTDSGGRYRLDSLPSGTVDVVVRRIGFAAMHEAAALTVREPRRLDVVLTEAQVLSAVKVLGKLDDGLAKVGFQARKDRSMGRFMTPEDVARNNPQLFTDLLRMTPGLVVTTRGAGRVIESTKAGGCVNFFIDNARFVSYTPGDVDGAFPASQIGAVETYSSATETPTEFQMMGKNCSTVVMWTKQWLSRP